MKVSRQRALIALKSHVSLKAAALSIPTTPEVLLRLTLDDPELTEAYKQCVDGTLRRRLKEEEALEKRAKASEVRPVSERTEEKRKMRFFAAVGRDPRVAAAALHARLNKQRKQDKAADLEEALDRLAELQSVGKVSKPISKAVLDVIDRWCGNCKEHRVDDPCEVCGRHTLLVK